jgi:phosphoglycerate kinase
MKIECLNIKFFIKNYMNIKTIQNFQVENKNVLLRVDFNVSLDKNENIIEAHKILAAQESLDWLIKNGAKKVVLLTHFGRPEGKNDSRFSVRQIADDVERILKRPIFFIDDCVGEKVQQVVKFGNHQIILLENK